MRYRYSNGRAEPYANGSRNRTETGARPMTGKNDENSERCERQVVRQPSGGIGTAEQGCDAAGIGVSTIAHGQMRGPGAPSRVPGNDGTSGRFHKTPPTAKHGFAAGIRAEQERRANCAGSARRGGFRMNAPRHFWSLVSARHRTVVARWSQTGAASAADVTKVATMSTQWSESSEYPELE